MNKHKKASAPELGTLAEAARALMAATADVAGETVAEARKRLAAALDTARDMAARAQDQAVDYAEAADEAVHEHPYKAIGIAFGVGAVLGCLAMRNCSCNGDK